MVLFVVFYFFNLMYYLLFDIGGTKTRIGVSSDRKEIEKREVFSTPSEYKDGISLIRNFVDSNSLWGKIEGACGGVAGPLNKERSMFLNSPNLPLWARRPIRQDLSDMFKAPVHLENDTALVALGEATRGSGQENRIVAYLGIGTGVGGARVVDGKIDAYSIGFEPGHQIIDMTSAYYDACGPLGHLEAFISGSGIERMYNEKPEEINDRKVFEDIARVLAYAVNNTIVYWSPDIVVLGGSMMKLIPIDLVKFYLTEIFRLYPEIPPLKEAILGDSAGLYGALSILSQENG